RADGPGRALVIEIMVPNPAIRNLIRDDKVHQIYSAMQVGQDRHAMQTMNQSLYVLYEKKTISFDEAMSASSDPDELRNMLEGKARIPAGLRAGSLRGQMNATPQK